MPKIQGSSISFVTKYYEHHPGLSRSLNHYTKAENHWQVPYRILFLAIFCKVNHQLRNSPKHLCIPAGGPCLPKPRHVMNLSKRCLQKLWNILKYCIAKSVRITGVACNSVQDKFFIRVYCHDHPTMTRFGILFLWATTMKCAEQLRLNENQELQGTRPTWTPTAQARIRSLPCPSQRFWWFHVISHSSGIFFGEAAWFFRFRGDPQSSFGFSCCRSLSENQLGIRSLIRWTCKVIAPKAKGTQSNSTGGLL